MDKQTVRRRRRRTRGIALVESLIAISMITIMFASTVWFQRMFAAKSRAMRAARLQAWSATIPGCEGDEVKGGMSIKASAPAMFSGAMMPAESTLSATATMKCNIEPTPFDGIEGLVEGLWSSIQNSVF